MNDELKNAITIRSGEHQDFFALDSPENSCLTKQKSLGTKVVKFEEGLGNSAPRKMICESKSGKKLHNFKEELVKVNNHFTSSEIDVIEYEYQKVNMANQQSDRDHTDTEFQKLTYSNSECIEDSHLNNNYASNGSMKAPTNLKILDPTLSPIKFLDNADQFNVKINIPFNKSLLDHDLTDNDEKELVGKFYKELEYKLETLRGSKNYEDF